MILVPLQCCILTEVCWSAERHDSQIVRRSDADCPITRTRSPFRACHVRTEWNGVFPQFSLCCDAGDAAKSPAVAFSCRRRRDARPAARSAQETASPQSLHSPRLRSFYQPGLGHPRSLIPSRITESERHFDCRGITLAIPNSHHQNRGGALQDDSASGLRSEIHSDAHS